MNIVVDRDVWYGLLDALTDLFQEVEHLQEAFSNAVGNFKEVEGKVVALRLVKGENDEN